MLFNALRMRHRRKKEIAELIKAMENSTGYRHMACKAVGFARYANIGRQLYPAREQLLQEYTRHPSSFYLPLRNVNGVASLRPGTKPYELDFALSLLPNATEVTYRIALVPTNAWGKRIVANDIVLNTTFMSTSVEPSFCDAWAPYSRFEHDILMLRILGRTGKNISHVSASPHEAEVLFRPGTTFRVIAIQRTSHERVFALINEVSDWSGPMKHMYHGGAL